MPKPDPFCYGCDGTGFIRWAGTPPDTPCLCCEEDEDDDA